MVNSAIQSTSKFLRLKVFKTMEKCKLQMAANRRALKSLQHFQEKCPHASWVEMELGHLRNELTNLEDKISQTKFHAAGAKWARLGDNVNSEFFAYYKGGHSSSCMRQLQREHINEMRDIATSFYKNLLNTQQFSVQQLQKRKIVLDCLEHKVSNEMAEALVKAISSAEERAALVAVGKNVCPGNDGLSLEFFLEYWDDIADVFTSSLQEVFKLGRMPAEWNEGMVYLIPKLEGVVDDIKKWRPITLLNTVYKVYAKLLATRLQPFLPHIVHKTQTGFIQERSIFDNIFMFWEMIAIAQETKQELTILLLDFEKAYDRVDWNFLYEVMGRLGLPSDYVKAVFALYNSAASRVLVGGALGNTFPITRSVRQGCPLAPYLFLFVGEAFSAFLHKNKLSIKGI